MTMNSLVRLPTLMTKVLPHLSALTKMMLTTIGVEKSAQQVRTTQVSCLHRFPRTSFENARQHWLNQKQWKACPLLLVTRFLHKTRMNEKTRCWIQACALIMYVCNLCRAVSKEYRNPDSEGIKWKEIFSQFTSMVFGFLLLGVGMKFSHLPFQIPTPRDSGHTSWIYFHQILNLHDNGILNFKLMQQAKWNFYRSSNSLLLMSQLTNFGHLQDQLWTKRHKKEGEDDPKKQQK